MRDEEVKEYSENSRKCSRLSTKDTLTIATDTSQVNNG